MKKIKFSDLQFHPRFGDGVISMMRGEEQATMDFDNGFGVSVVFGEIFYSNGVDTYELAVMKDGELHYDNPVANGDVCGYLKKTELMKLINEVANFKDSL